jgi:hypothetical protein
MLMSQSLTHQQLLCWWCRREAGGGGAEVRARGAAAGAPGQHARHAAAAVARGCAGAAAACRLSLVPPGRSRHSPTHAGFMRMSFIALRTAAPMHLQARMGSGRRSCRQPKPPGEPGMASLSVASDMCALCICHSATGCKADGARSREDNYCRCRQAAEAAVCQRLQAPPPRRRPPARRRLSASALRAASSHIAPRSQGVEPSAVWCAMYHSYRWCSLMLACCGLAPLIWRCKA